MRKLALPLLILLSALSLPVHGDRHGKQEVRGQLGILPSPLPEKLTRDSLKEISGKHAITLVKQRHATSRVLGFSLLDEAGAPVYRVRTLSPDGVVRSVFVDGLTGEVFD